MHQPAARSFYSAASLLLLCVLGLLGGCHRVPAHDLPSALPTRERPGPDSADEVAAALRRHVSVLASDSFRGRHPTGPGGLATVAYISAEFERVGLAPANADSSFTQRVPLFEYRASTEVRHRHDDVEVRLSSPDEVFAWSVDLTQRETAGVLLEARPLVFAGYGISAPEHGWDDYGDADLDGTIVLVLPGDPPAVPNEPEPGAGIQPFPSDSASRHALVASKAAAAAERGAAAIVVIVDPHMNGSDYSVFAQSLARERLVLRDPADPSQPSMGGGARAPGRGMLMSPAAASTLFRNAGSDYAELLRAAQRRDFTARPIPGTVSVEVEARVRAAESHNVVGMLEGGHPLLKHQIVLYLAHWDHLGEDPTRDGDQIFNGAMDNAAGVAQMIEIARWLASRPVPAHRSILFVATTAEEANLLGSTYYAANPLFPLQCTAAALNLDGGFPFGRTHDVVAIGAGSSTLDHVLSDALAAQGRWQSRDAREFEYFQRSDHYALALVGVPALFVLPGHAARDRPPGWGEAKLRYFMENHFHQPSDTLRTDYDLRGLAEDARLMYDVGLRIAMDAEMPQWTDDVRYAEYRDRRTAAMEGFRLEHCSAPRGASRNAEEGARR